MHFFPSKNDRLHWEFENLELQTVHIFGTSLHFYSLSGLDNCDVTWWKWRNWELNAELRNINQTSFFCTFPFEENTLLFEIEKKRP